MIDNDDELLNFDFDVEVEETQNNINAVEEKTSKNIKKVNNMASKIDKISSNFNITLNKINEMTDVVENNINEVKKNAIIDVHDLFQLDMLHQDFMSVRSTLLDTVSKGKTVIDVITAEISLNPTDAEMVASYSSLINTINSSMRLLNSSYKDIVDIVLKIKKIEESKNKENETSNITNIQNNFYAESMNDIVKQLKNMN